MPNKAYSSWNRSKRRIKRGRSVREAQPWSCLNLLDNNDNDDSHALMIRLKVASIQKLARPRTSGCFKAGSAACLGVSLGLALDVNREIEVRFFLS